MNWISIGSDNGLSPGRRQAIIWTNARKLLFGPPGAKFSEIVIEIHTFSINEMYLKMSSGKWQPFCLGLNVLTYHITTPLCYFICWYHWLINVSQKQGLRTIVLIYKLIWSVLEYSWWRHLMETFSALLALCAGNSPVPVNSTHKGLWRGALMFSLICI